MDTLIPAARSWLFVPATRPERFEKAAASGADRIIIDLEDAVEPSAKTGARAALAAAVLPPSGQLFVRVNACGSQWFEDDLALVGTLATAGLVLPKVESASHVAAALSRLPAPRRVVAMIETAAGLWNVQDVAGSSGVERLAFGALDFQVDAGISADPAGEIELAYARSRMVLASRVAGIDAPIDSVTPAIDDELRLSDDAQRARRFGFAGKLCIHPRQVAPVNRAFLPTREEIEWALGLLEQQAALPEQQRGAFAYRGNMVDRPVVERALRIRALVEHGGNTA